MTEGKGNPHELFLVQIKAFFLGEVGEQLNLIFRTYTHGKPPITLCKLPQIITNTPIPSQVCALALV